MADNAIVNTNKDALGATNVTVAADDVGGVLVQRVKVQYGADGVGIDIDTGTPLPVVQSSVTHKTLATQVTGTDTGPVVNAVIHALSSAGGGTYVDVKCSPSGALTVDASGSTLPLPTGAATESTLSAINGKLPALVGGSQPVKVVGTPGAFQPGYDAQDQGTTELTVDPGGNLRARAQVLTDEGTSRVNFSNTSLAVAIGTVTLTNGSAAVAWTLTPTLDLHVGDYVKLNADSESAWAQIDSIDSNTTGTLVSAYTGTGGTGAGSRALVRPFTGSGGGWSVGSGQLTLTSGTTNGANTGVDRLVDVAPLVFRSRASISQRIANQEIHIGLEEATEPARWFARFLADGTTDTTIKTQTGRNPTGAPSAAEIEEYTVTIPNGLTSATMQDFRIEQLAEAVMFYIQGVNVATHTRTIPAQHDQMREHVEIRNGTGAASSTSVVVDFITCKNHNKLEVGILSEGEKIVAVPPPTDEFTYNVAGVIAINTVLIQIDTRQYKSLAWQCTSMGTTGVVTPEWSINGTDWTGDTFFTIAGAAATTFNAAGAWFTNVKLRYFRLRLSTATTAGTTTIRVHACMVRQQQFYASQTVTASNLSCNTAQWGGQTVINIQPNGSTNRGIVAGLGGPTSNTDYSAQAWAAASGSGAVIANAQGLGVSSAFDVNLTAWTAGASTGLDIYLQESPDNGTTFYDIWQCEALTAVSRARIPAIPIGGRRRFRWVNRTGAATTATVTVTAMDCSGVFNRQAQFFDRTSGVGSGTAVLNTNSASYNINGLTAITVVMQAGTATAVGSFQVQMSIDGTNWYAASAATAIAATTANNTIIPITAGVYGRFLRVTCTAAGTTQVINAIHIYGVE